jgi:NAD-dependent DNA ligase
MALYAKLHHNVQFLSLHNYFMKDVALPWISWVNLALGKYFLNFTGAS